MVLDDNEDNSDDYNAVRNSKSNDEARGENFMQQIKEEVEVTPKPRLNP